jgi:hypothetical protein
LVSLDLQGMRAMSMVIGMTYIFGVLQVPPSSPVVGATMATMVGPSSSGSGGTEPLAKMAHPW